ncbi:MAG: monoamine oxidase [Saprospiraceae bacterium]|jgi:monoamine oxidase
MIKETIETDILIIGAGLTGLTIAYALKDSNLSIKIVEARNRIGGRIETVETVDGVKVEMGATWLGNKHTYLARLLAELGINTFEQIIGDTAIYEAISTSPHYLARIPPNPEPSLRITGGSEALIKKLSSYISVENIFLDAKVESIKKSKIGVITDCVHSIFKSKIVISTLPPNLLVNSINFDGALPHSLLSVAKNTHTWMGESIKIALTYATPFWRSEELSGTIMSNVGPIPEMYDHSNAEDNKYALMGFLNGGYFQLTKKERLAIIMKQLKKYYGKLAETYTNYEERVWRIESETFTPYESNVLPHQLNGHDVYQESYLADRLMLAGTETSTYYPGYMEGAVYSGLLTSKKILEKLKHDR